MLIILINRVSLSDSILVSDVQSRAGDSEPLLCSPLSICDVIILRTDLISVMACSALLLNVLSEQDITAGEREAVAVRFYNYFSPDCRF